jgi:hypothetical protein
MMTAGEQGMALKHGWGEWCNDLEDTAGEVKLSSRKEPVRLALKAP